MLNLVGITWVSPVDILDRIESLSSPPASVASAAAASPVSPSPAFAFSVAFPVSSTDKSLPN